MLADLANGARVADAADGVMLWTRQLRRVGSGFKGEVVPGVGFAGTRVTPVIQPDPMEVRRREQTGLGAVLDFDLTDRLAELPVDWPVPRDDLDPATQRLLDTAPPGVVEETATAVICRWRPAVTPTATLRQGPHAALRDRPPG
jgi:hypothetical protein